MATTLEFPRPNVAVSVNSYSPAADLCLVEVGVPAIVAVPSPLLWNYRPFGSLPFDFIFGVGEPVVVTRNETGWPTAPVTVLTLSMRGEELNPAPEATPSTESITLLFVSENQRSALVAEVGTKVMPCGLSRATLVEESPL